MEPNVFDNVSQDMKIVAEEIFGPVVVVHLLKTLMRLSSEVTILNMVSPQVFRQKISKAHKVAKGLKVGTIWVNCHNIFDAAAPFGGYKRSGFDREMGIHALENYTQVKNVIIQLHQLAAGPNLVETG